MQLWQQAVERIVDNALAEDLGAGDITTDALIAPDLRGRAAALVKADGVLAGIDVFATAFRRVDATVEVQVALPDGSRIRRGDVVATVSGPLACILKAERVALNFLQRLSGVATETARYVEAVGERPVRIVETRKTTPGLRLLEKYAVRVGGGFNHRMNLSDGVLIKDNHIAVLQAQGLSLRDIVERARRYAPHTVAVEIEVTTVAMAAEAAATGADVILLDNMAPDEMRQAVEAIGGRARTEASGGIRLDNVRAVADSGVDIISSGALTHSVRALDISLEVEAIL